MRTHGSIRTVNTELGELTLYPCEARGAWFEVGHHGEVGTLLAPMRRDGSFDPAEIGEADCTYEQASGSCESCDVTEESMTLEIVPISLRAANAYVEQHHRHHGAARGHKFSLAVATITEGDPTIHGVAIVGRPVARHLDDGWTLEVNRTCTDGTPNANSMLWAAWRAAKAMGYRRLVTYTQAGESGSSLRAAGFRVIAQRAPRKSWAASSVKLRELRDPAGSGGVARTLWEVE